MSTVRSSIVAAVLAAMVLGPAALAADTPKPQSVTVVGSLQSELGCPGDWQPECSTTFLPFNADSAIWAGTFDLPAGGYEYKAALNGGWDENYGRNARRNGDNIPLSLAEARAVKFYYDHETHWITDNVTSIIASVPGSFQSELGCPGDWAPDCLRSWLQDTDGDGVYWFSTRLIPAGDYEAKVAIDESWAVNYGQGGALNGPNIPFTVPADGTEMFFVWDSTSKVLEITTSSPVPTEPASVTIAGSLQSELGCPGDWQPECSATHLLFDGEDGVWQNLFNLPAGGFEYKAALDGGWAENYGRNAQRDGANIPLTLAADRTVKFFYDHRTHWVTDNVNSVIATVPGNFQRWLGCPGDWQPDCLRTWLQDTDGDGIYAFATRDIPQGNYEAKVAINESWDENYGQNGQQNGPNISFSVPRSGAEMFFAYDPVTHVLTISAEGGPRGNLAKAKAHWVLRDTLAWPAAPPADGSAFWLHFDPSGAMTLTQDGIVGGTALALTVDPAGLPPSVLEKFPHLAGATALKLAAADVAAVPGILEQQIAVSARDAAGAMLDATSVQLPGVLDDLYTYDGALGLTWDEGVPTLRLWAPTARNVELLLFADSNPATPPTVLPLTRDDKGVWSATGTAGWKNQFYRYRVEVYVRKTNKLEVNEVTDPYSFTLSTNSRRTQFVDLADPALKPAHWDRLQKPRLQKFTDIALYELHVRDFSANDATVPERLRGTYKAFAVPSNGTRHLATLAFAGLTHVHVLPSFDITSVDEDKSTWQSPGDLSAYPPDGTEQQAAVTAIADADGFNWGYDPWHFMAPEGSYATNPDGAARVREYREMVAGLSRAGLRVVMDSVYNHTSASGQNEKSVLDRIVPGYYHRYDADGNVTNSTCCENTATEHNMMEKLMIDALVLWAREYKIDGFRFDLMGHHMKRNMLKAQAALAALTPRKDGVDGSRIYLYGEGWNFGEVADNARGVNATQLNMAGTGIGTFSDRLRDAARGGGPFSGLQVQGFLTGLYVDPNGIDQGPPEEQKSKLLLHQDQIRTGLAAALRDYTFVDRHGNTVTSAQVDYNGQPSGYTENPQEVINYVSAHDNETLFDAIQLKLPVDTPMRDRVRVQNLGLSLVGLGQGIPFFHAGDELLRSKSMDRDSYNSGDWFNKIDYSYRSNNWGVGLPPAGKNQANWPLMQPLLADPALKPAPRDIMASYFHFLETLAIRSSSHLFRLDTAEEIEAKLRFHNTGPDQAPGLIVMSLSDGPDACSPPPASTPVRGKAPGAGRPPQGPVRPVKPLLPDYGYAVVLFNAAPDAVSFGDAGFAGLKLYLHPVQASSMDPVLKQARFDEKTGTFTVPGRTAAVFVCGPGPRAFKIKW